MAKRLFTRILLGCPNKLIKKPLNIMQNTRNFSSSEVPVKEIEIPVRWGHIAARLWGNAEAQRPILALHGWQDNAGTWDTLAPLMIQNGTPPILAVDLPGHGLSSWIPPGMQYYSWEFLRLILFLKDYFKWDKISLLSHSMGAIASFRFASLYSDDVDFFIAVDSLIYDDYDLDMVVSKYPEILKKLQIEQGRLGEEPPSYTREELIKIWHLGTRKSVALDSVPHLMKRGTKPSKNDPNKFYFSRDARLKHFLFNPEDKKFVEALALRVKCPTLYIKGIDSPYSTDAYSVEMRNTIEKNNAHFNSQFLPGTHHLHLNTPELLLPHILKFLDTHVAK